MDKWKKLMQQLGEGPSMEFDEMDIRPEAGPVNDKFPVLDIRPESQRMMKFPELDIRPDAVNRPGQVELGEFDVSTQDLGSTALERLAGGRASQMDMRPNNGAERIRRGTAVPTFAPEEDAPALKPFAGWKQTPGSPEDRSDRELKQGKSAPSSPMPDRSGVKALIAKARPPKAKPTGYGGLTEADINSVGEQPYGPEFAGAFPEQQEAPPAMAQSRQPLRPPMPAGGQHMPGETPPMGQDGNGSGNNELAAAQSRARSAEREAQYANGMGRAADMIAGTPHLSDRAGEDVRAAGKQGVDDVLAQSEERRRVEDQGFQRAGEQRAQGLDGRQTRAADDAHTGQIEAQGYADPASQQSAARRAQVTAFAAANPQYREVVGALPPGEFSKMSAKMLDAMLTELPMKEEKLGGAGPGPRKGLSQAALNSMARAMPPEAVNTYTTLQRIRQLAQAGGGYEKIGGVAFAGGLVPGLGLTERQKAFRQELGQLTGTYLASKGGKSITEGEKKILLDNIAADPLSPRVTPAMIERAVGIIEDSVRGNMRQGSAFWPEEQRNQWSSSTGVPRDWIEGDATQASGGERLPHGQKAPYMIRLKNGEEVEQAD